ncbi:MAG: hypothetical protein M1832_003440 [Thelocarpon impressellum]|nr:MAG: hypothetical protein M1832_003440 [Thelocarpon impressellum]
MIEADVLRVKDPALLDSNDWPEFALEDVIVYQGSPSSLVSLLDADTHNGVVVCGFLREVDEDQRSLVVSLGEEGALVMLEDVRQFAHGSYEDGSIGLWAAGNAGWYEIRPADEYREIYDGMGQAVRLLHCLEDKYSRSRKRGRKMLPGSVDELWDKYVADNDNCADAAQAAELFYRHRGFLIAVMLKEEAKVRWNKTAFFKHLQGRFPDEFARIQSRHAPTGDSTEAPGVIEDPPRAAVPAEPIDVRPSRSQKNLEATTSHKAKYYHIFKHLEKVRCAGRLSLGQMTIEGFGDALHEDFEIDSAEVGAKILQAYGPGLRGMMKSAKRRSSPFDWTKRQIFKQLSSLEGLNEALGEYLRIPLRPRTSPLRPHPTRGKSRASRDSSTADVDQRTSTHASKGSLRLKDKVSLKAAARRGSGPTGVEEERAASQQPSEESDIPVTGKRKGNDQERSESAKRHVKAEADGASLYDIILPFSWDKRPLDPHDPFIKFIEQPLPSTDGHGPEDAWTCTVDGCLRRVFGASSLDGQKRIRAHYAEHVGPVREKLDLVLEESRRRLPINNLVDRIREMAAMEAERLARGELSPLANGTKPR